MTPNFAIVHIQHPRSRGYRLWIPLFLLWIPAILLSPVIFLVLFGLCLAGHVSPWNAIKTLWAILSNMPGTDVSVHAKHKHVLVRIL